MNAKQSTFLVQFNGYYKRFLSILTGKWPQCSQLSRHGVPARLIHANRCSSKTLCHLNSRAVVRLAGPDTLNFLQGLVTNDVYQLTQEGVTSQYTMMLNVQGRILYDMFLYNISQDLNSPILLVDVDRSATEDLIKTLKRYKLRKKVDISDAGDEFQVWSKFKLSVDDTNVRNSTTSTPDDALIVTLDPRVPSFGKRIIRQGHNDEWIRNSVDESVYRQMRYQWGIPEGHSDLPTGNCFPLESNLAFMNGVDFHKGCYIGQELTARTHHTGVTRKRLMPVFLSSPASSLGCDAIIVNEKGRSAGKLRSHEESHGLGLVRLAYINDNLSIRDGDTILTQVKTNIPAWWPPLD